MITITNIIFIVALTNLWIYAEPLIYLKRFFGFKEENYDNYSKYKQTLYRLINCAYCSSFWISVCVFPVIGHIPLLVQYVIITTLAAYIIDGLMNR
jgi:hypothetical protein